MKIESRKLADLKHYENNPRNNGEAVSKVKLSIRKYGYKVLIVIDSDNYIIAGHTRHQALLELHSETGEYKNIQVVVADDLDEDEVKEFRIVDNQVAGLATWDYMKLRLELDGLDDFVLDDFGDIEGFNIELGVDEDEPVVEETKSITIAVGNDKFTMSETAYHAWCVYIVDNKGKSVLDFVKQALEIAPSDRKYSQLDV